MNKTLHLLAGTTLVLAAIASGCGDGSDTQATGGGGSGGSGGAGAAGGSGGSGGSGASGGSGGAGAAGGGGAGAAGGGGAGGAGGGGACDGYQGQASVAEIGLSPFANQEAEMLALEASGELVAPQHVYERVLADLAAIRAMQPAVQNVSAMGSWSPSQMLVGLDAAGMAAVQAGTYTDWDCANAHYGLSMKEVQSFYVKLAFSHRFNIPLLASEYAMFENVEYAEPDGLIGDGNDVCVSVEGDKKYNYVFDAGSGDCQAGCIQHTYWGFSTEGSPPVVTVLGTFSNQDPQTPAWFGALGACTAWL